MAISTITAPAVEPLDATDAKLREHLYLTAGETYQDTVLDAYCAAARDLVEGFLRKRLITQTVRLTLDGFGCGRGEAIHLPIGPVQSVEQVQYLDSDGTWQTLAASRYRLIDSVNPPELRPEYGQTWPTPRPDHATVRIDLIVGYGDAGSDLDPAIMQAMRLLVAEMFDKRETSGDARMAELPLSFRTMLGPKRLWV